MTEKLRVKISPEAVFLAFALLFALDIKSLAALMLPIVFHELGHAAVLRLFGLKIHTLRAEITGLCLECDSAGLKEQFLSALAGPAAGFCYALLSARLSRSLHSELLGVSAGMSLLFSIFNLLPALPLDGGRMAEAVLLRFLPAYKCDRVMRVLGIITGLLLCAAAVWLLINGYGVALLPAGVKILVDNISGE